MTVRHLHPLAADYLDRLDRAASRLPYGRRRELLDDIEEHLAETAPPAAEETDVRTALDRLGAPEEIADAEPAAAAPGPRAPALHDWGAIVLLLFGGWVFSVGWFAGLILLWSSGSWRTRDKWIGTLLLPGGFLAATSLLAVLYVGGGLGSGEPGAGTLGLLLVLVAAPLLGATHLAQTRGAPGAVR